MEENNKIITTSEWIITKLIMFIPSVNIIMLIIWGFNNKTTINCKRLLLVIIAYNNGGYMSRNKCWVCKKDLNFVHDVLVFGSKYIFVEIVL